MISAALHDEPSMIRSPANHKRDNVTGLNSDTCFWPIDHLAIKKILRYSIEKIHKVARTQKYCVSVKHINTFNFKH